MKLKNEIQDGNLLIRTISGPELKYFDALCCSVLIGYEYKWLSKIQFNIYSSHGSVHLEYKDRTVSLYEKGLFEEPSTLLMTVSIIPQSGNAHTSTVTAISLLDCFNEYLRISDQRLSSIEKFDQKLIRTEILPKTTLNLFSGILETIEIEVLFQNNFV